MRMNLLYNNLDIIVSDKNIITANIEKQFTIFFTDQLHSCAVEEKYNKLFYYIQSNEIQKNID